MRIGIAMEGYQMLILVGSQDEGSMRSVGEMKWG